MPSTVTEQPTLKFRNYNVRDQEIEHTVLEPAKAPEYEAAKPEASAGRAAEVKVVSANVQHIDPGDTYNTDF